MLTYVLRSDAALGQYLSLSSSSSICQPILVSVCPPSFHLSLMNSQVLNGNWQNRDIVNSCSSCASPPREHAHSRWRATTTMYNAAHLSQFRACSWQEFGTEIQGKKKKSQNKTEKCITWRDVMRNAGYKDENTVELSLVIEICVRRHSSRSV